MNRIQRLILLSIPVLLLSSPARSHERFTDPVLAELNDCLMALQVLRFGDAQAAELFSFWQSVRDASWKIRDLTDEQDLPANHPAVRQQVAEARNSRRQLHQRCRDYFGSLESRLPTASFRVGEVLDVSWPDQILESRIGSRDVILIKIANETQRRIYAELSAQENEQILFWKRTISIEPSDFRYAFAYLVFSKPGQTSTWLVLRTGSGTRQIAIRASGVPLPARAPVRLDAVTSTRVELRTSDAPDGSDRAPFPASFIRFRIRDKETEEPLPVRVEVLDRHYRFHWTPLRGPSYSVGRENVGWETPLWEFQPGPYFYIDGFGELGVDPAGKIARLYHGFEYRPSEITVPADGLIDVCMERWINMPERGWYSGQTHIHSTDAGLPVQLSEFWPLISRAEDLAVSYILTLKGEWNTHAVYADEYPPGVVSSASSPRHIIAYGEEYRNNPYGHLALLGLEQLIQPISSGALGELAGADYPPNAFVLEAALAMGATTVGAHFGNYILEGKPVRSRWPSTGFEMPVDVALKKMQVAEVYGNGGQRDVWYKLLNCGFEIAATAGPDWEIKDTPRTYVYLGRQPPTLEEWTAGMSKGESFITHGPMLFLHVDGARPGGRLHYDDPRRAVRVEARALTPAGLQPVEIVINGHVAAQGQEISQEIVLEDSAWIAARTEGAHTNPVYVRLQGRPVRTPGDARDFISVTDRLIEWVEQKGLFDSPEQRETVLSVLREGRRVFQEIAGQ